MGQGEAYLRPWASLTGFLFPGLTCHVTLIPEPREAILREAPMHLAHRRTTEGGLKVVGLFAGIGGIELGLQAAGHRTQLLCEFDAGAKSVLRAHFPRIELAPDVRELSDVGGADLVTAGFPCQDLSQAGRTAGIGGKNSGLVSHVFRLLDARKAQPNWLLLENVPFMLHLDRGDAMGFLIQQLERRGYSWAYRVVDSRAFGLPQRRQRVILLASKSSDPRPALLNEDAGERLSEGRTSVWRGFYWTEGLRGLGWAVDAVPTLKGGSTIGIPSPPAIWNPSAGIFTPDIRDAERLQGFAANWTAPILDIADVKKGHRWKLVGNAVSVPVARWVGERLLTTEEFKAAGEVRELSDVGAWPRAAFGAGGKAYGVDVSSWPVQWPRPHLADFIRYPMVPLSTRAAAGFLKRARISTLSFEPGFLKAIERHIRQVRDLPVEATSRSCVGIA